MNRFTDIHPSFKRLTPVYDDRTTPLLTLDDGESTATAMTAIIKPRSGEYRRRTPVMKMSGALRDSFVASTFRQTMIDAVALTPFFRRAQISQMDAARSHCGGRK